jgi:prepilin-type N-terminal cleavage/methylation domain-containing protein
MTLIELIIVMAILTIGLGTASIFLKSTENPLKTGTVLVEGSFREARLMAIASTTAHRVSPAGSGGLQMEHAMTCAETTWIETDLPPLELPHDVVIENSDWSVCFNSRGVSNNNVVVTLTHPTFGSTRVEVLLGGTTRVLD